MSELISGKEALIALASGSDVEFLCQRDGQWKDIFSYHPSLKVMVKDEIDQNNKFRLKPRTIMLNGVEVPAPFEPKEGERYWFMSTSTILGYACNDFELDKIDSRFMVNGAWKSEDEIKQVVAALRKIFVINNQ